ncbi:MAG: hypothetical protein JKX99_02525 [Robiginitomaculum sp.]|nr:hypothetical protein [Robiginitomaculum sp.]
MRNFFGLLLISVASFGLLLSGVFSPATSQTGNTQPAPATIPVTDQPVTAVMFYSNWCGACQILDPKIEAVKLGFTERPIEFVKFDFSFALVRGGALQALAEEKGLANIYAKNKGKTGFMLLIDPATEQVIDIITMRDSTETIAVKLNNSLQRI